MAFCTSCGKAVDDSSRFCPGCGAAVPAAAIASQPAPVTQPPAPAPVASAPQAVPAPAPPQQPQQAQSGGGGVLKILLVIVLVVVLLAVIAVVGVVGAVYYASKHTHVTTTVPNSGHIETPFGTVDASNDDPAKIAESMGIDVYPGATPVKNGGASVSAGGYNTASASFTTSDTPEQVMKFYMDQYPDAIHSESRGNHTLALSKKDKTMAITAESMGSETRITITKVTGKIQ